MRIPYLIVCLILTGLLVGSCASRLSSFWYRKSRKALHYQRKAQMGLPDTLHVQNYFLCKLHRYGLLHRGEPAEINADSTWSYFRTALEAQPLPVVFQTPGQPTCDSTLALHYKLRKNQIDLDDIRAWGQVRADDRLRLVPTIHIEYGFRRHVYAAGAGFASSGMYRDIFLSLQVYVFRGEDLIFSRAMYHLSDSREVDNYNAPVVSPQQEHWDKLVDLVMKPYVKQLSAEAGDPSSED